MHDKMLENYFRLKPEFLVEMAEELGLDMEKFKADLNAEWTLKRMEADLKLARSIDIWQTPTYLINGRMLVGERPIEHFKRIIDEELQAGEGK
jgi:predicted DsbA family dithiol-disulfide isomerase